MRIDRIVILVLIATAIVIFVRSVNQPSLHEHKPVHKVAVAHTTVAKPTIKSSANHKLVTVKEDGVRVMGAVNLRFEE